MTNSLRTLIECGPNCIAATPDDIRDVLASNRALLEELRNAPIPFPHTIEAMEGFERELLEIVQEEGMQL